MVLENLLERGSYISRTNGSRFLKLVERQTITGCLKGSYRFDQARLVHGVSDTVIYVGRNLSVFAGHRSAFLRQKGGQFRICLTVECQL